MQERHGGKYLTPWQEHHALLVVQTVKEINELRFVLCPKRMTDNQFWKVYFTLAQKYLPPEAFAPAPQEQKQEVLAFCRLLCRILLCCVEEGIGLEMLMKDSSVQVAF